ncbi:MAG TPA: hypothetical protein V6C81_03990 [Planktothrix sp.]|jgi:hypothetical protein
MKNSFPVAESVSYMDLLVELQTRLDCGWNPQDILYFTELSIELIEAHRLSSYRVIAYLEHALSLPAHKSEPVSKPAA